MNLSNFQVQSLANAVPSEPLLVPSATNAHLYSSSAAPLEASPLLVGSFYHDRLMTTETGLERKQALPSQKKFSEKSIDYIQILEFRFERHFYKHKEIVYI